MKAAAAAAPFAKPAVAVMLPAAILGAVILGTATTPAAADSIYLNSGRVIHSETVRTKDGRVYFTQFGGTVSIPLDEVARIVENDEAERVTGPPGATSAPNVGARDPASAAAPGAAAGAAASEGGSAGATAATPAPPSSEPTYWIEHILEVDERIARVQTELDRLPLYDEVDQRLLRFSGQALYFIAEREKWETLIRELKLTRRRLLHGAREAGIPPGALRKGLGG